MKKKLLITGGHVTPALAVIDTIQRDNLPYDIIFVGRQFNNEFEESTSFEYKEVVSRNISFIHLTTGRFTRALNINSLRHLLRIPQGFWQAYSILQKEKPDVVLSFGGYLALPVAIMAFLKNIPVYTHEQTIVPGLANKLIARVAKKIFISFPESQKYFNSSKTIVTGNPVREIIFEKKQSITLPTDSLCIYVTGGSLGSHALNQHIYNLLPELLEKYILIHQTGNVKEYNDYERLSEKRSTLPEKLRQRYIIKEHILDDEIGDVYQAAHLVIGRSGANTFFELVALEKPAIFIPLPWSANGEQQLHAEIFQKAKAGEIFEQKRTSQELFSIINSMMDTISIYTQNVTTLQKYYQREAAQAIIESIT